MLQAWHRSYDNMLIELEHFWLNNLVGGMLDGMAAQIASAQQEVGSGPLRASIRPMQLVQLAEMNFHHMNSPPALTSWRPASS